jgi:hypothetical protein
MNGIATNKAATGVEEQVGIIGRQTRQSVKGETVDSNRDRS